jgi:hypothetical protein
MSMPNSISEGQEVISPLTGHPTYSFPIRTPFTVRFKENSIFRSESCNAVLSEFHPKWPTKARQFWVFCGAAADEKPLKCHEMYTAALTGWEKWISGDNPGCWSAFIHRIQFSNTNRLDQSDWWSDSWCQSQSCDYWRERNETQGFCSDVTWSEFIEKDIMLSESEIGKLLKIPL